jgi:hypothetical protein
MINNNTNIIIKYYLTMATINSTTHISAEDAAAISRITTADELEQIGEYRFNERLKNKTNVDRDIRMIELEKSCDEINIIEYSAMFNKLNSEEQIQQVNYLKQCYCDERTLHLYKSNQLIECNKQITEMNITFSDNEGQILSYINEIESLEHNIQSLTSVYDIKNKAMLNRIEKLREKCKARNTTIESLTDENDILLHTNNDINDINNKITNQTFYLKLYIILLVLLIVCTHYMYNYEITNQYIINIVINIENICCNIYTNSSLLVNSIIN